MENKSLNLSQGQLQRWWFPLGVGLIVVIGTLTLLIPRINRIWEGRGEVKQNQELLSKLQAKAVALQELDINHLNQLQRLADAALPSTKPYFEVLGQLQAVSSTVGVSLGDYDMSPGSLATSEAKPNESERVALSTELSVRGSEENINAFVDALQNTLPLFTITGISYGQQIDELLTAQLAIEIYYQPVAVSEKAAAEKPLVKLSRESESLIESLSNYSVPDYSSMSATMDAGRQDIFRFE